jgi:catechol 2,3-dioxygenase-like lactoylglutathione lyase family enzyme
VIFELRVTDVPAAVKFYRDGLGMQVLTEDAKAPEALLEIFDTGLHIFPARKGAKSGTNTGGNPFLDITKANGVRYPSLWYKDPVAICDKVEKAGYRRPQNASNVCFARDPDGNPVEIMSVPRGMTKERFTAGYLVSNRNKGRLFLAEVLGVAEWDMWKLPAPAGNMHLFPIGPTFHTSRLPM